MLSKPIISMTCFDHKVVLQPKLFTIFKDVPGFILYDNVRVRNEYMYVCMYVYGSPVEFYVKRGDNSVRKHHYNVC